MSNLKYNSYKSFIALLIIVLCTCNYTVGQDFTFHNYGLEDGLSQETIRSIVKDSNGFLWIGTQDGLNRFDGSSFKVYKNSKKDSLTISGNFINALIEDHNGNIWIGTNDNGISIYDSNTNSFKAASINEGNCSSLGKTSNGTIIATILNKGIIIYKNKGENYTSRKITQINGEKLQFNTTYVDDNALYVSTKEDRLFISRDISEENVTFQEIILNKSVGTINALFVLKNHIWIGTSNGLFVYNTTKKSLSRVPLESKIEHNEKLNVTSIDVNRGRFYIGTFNGLFIGEKFDEEHLQFKELTTYKGEQEQTNSITSNRVYDTFTDGNLLWIGTNNLDVVTLTKPVFKNVNTFSNIALNNAFILSFAKNDDYLFVGTRKGINCIKNSGEVAYITKENTNQALAFDVIRGMSIDKNNYLWIATIKGVSTIDLTNFDPKAPKIISLYYDIDDPNSLSSNAARGVYIDHKNTVWIMTYGGGINRFTGDLKTNTITFEHYKTNSNDNSISSDFTYNMSQDKDLNYWITSEDGLNKLQFEASNYQRPKFTNYFHDKNDSRSLSSNTTLHTWHDANEALWVATQDGFNKFNRLDETFVRYGEDEGLTNTFVYSIIEDLNNNLWLTTNDGIFMFNKTNELFTNYNIGDGLQSSEFNLGAHFFDKTNNEIYVGGINGFNIFNPNKVTELDIESNLKFTSIRIRNQEINPTTHPNIINESITKTNEITLHQKDFPCYLTFSDLDLRPTKNNQFVYSLNDNEWNNLRDVREIQLLDLSKGIYRLKIQGKSRNTLWSKEPLELIINVTPPWYKSNAAYLVYLMALLSIFYIFYRLNLQHQLAGQEAKRLQELDALKSQFITNITHEFRTPLTIILGYVNTLKNALSKNKKLHKPIDSIEQNGNSLLRLVNEMLDLAKLEQGKLQLNNTKSDLIGFTNYLIASFSSLAASKNINLKSSTKRKSLMMDFDVEKIRQIISNLISNAIKFSNQNSSIEIAVNKEDGQAIIQIKDEGIGIPNDEIPFVFDRFYRSENTKGKISGSGIGLALTKELVNLMKGTITVNSQENIGTTFTISIPIKQEAETTTTDFDSEVIISKRLQYTTLPSQKLSDDSSTILIIDDNPEILSYIASCLELEYNLLFANNGEEGFITAEKNVPDIIITDIMMPVMDGYELTKKLQRTETTNHIPIIMLTAKAMQEDKLSGIKSGADAYLTKPFQKDELLLRIEMLIAKRKQLHEIYSVKKIITLDKSHIKQDKNLEFLEGVIQNIHKNIEDSEYNAIKLAGELYMSESQLYRKLKAITDKSTAIFMRSVRLEKAKELLESTNLTVSEIAYSTGFSNPNWFGKAFKEEFGKSPSGIRNYL